MNRDPQFLDPHRKRAREDEEDGTAAGPTEADAVTPQEPAPEPEMWADEPELLPANPAYSAPFDGDMDMMDTSEPVPGSDQPGIQGHTRIEPPSSEANPPGPSVTGRVPTPIHCNFPAQARVKTWSGGSIGYGDALATTPEEPNAAAFNGNGSVDISSQQPGAPGAAQALVDWTTLHNRPLPSPISECGGEENTETARMALDTSAPPGSNHLSHVMHEHPLLAGLPPRASSAMEGRSSTREGTLGGEPQNAGGAMDLESAGAVPSPKKGHTRSKHTLSSWTALQPGMKRTFSLGYRADCEKCRMKVPGHFNHIIIS
ncbi:cb110a06-f0cb-4d04-8068-681141d2c8d8 [Thermothielavioides terrestris]|uniref:Cb110a06-f0cb-4d04-8068-681141d2c8d8 n=1 Tax=Thermothielavioides terrestris TaxID=2587410 RepID=A0A446BW61_9PEZI|nr:cb110a06-f0cb-4d04-8068-681141d2c8d8 [Thermothielavioides terrestris]